MTLKDIDVITIECPTEGCNGVIVTTIEELKTKGALECSNEHEIFINAS